LDGVGIRSGTLAMEMGDGDTHSALVKPGDGDGDAAAKWRLVMALLVVSIAIPAPRIPHPNLPSNVATGHVLRDWELEVGSRDGDGDAAGAWNWDCCAACQD